MSNPENLSESPPPIDLDSYRDMSVGDILRKAREYYGQSLAEVEGNLRIRSSQLEALEKLRLDKLPGRVYAIGFVRSYSEYLGLDGDKMVHLFKAQSVGKRNKPNLQFPVTYDENNSPNVVIVFISLVGLVSLISYWAIFKTPTKYQESIPPVPELLKKSSIDLAKPKEKVLAVPKEPTKIVNHMELVITQDSWIEIQDADGKKLLSQVLKTGDKYIVPDETGLVLTTGNAGGVMVYIDGKKTKTIGKSSQVMRDVKLIPKNFSKNADND